MASGVSDVQEQPMTSMTGTQSADDGAMVRVLLVGRTGVDAALRLDSGLELVRVPSLLEAIAELAQPLPGGPDRVCVIVAEHVLRDAAPARVERFTTLARETHEGIRLLAGAPGVEGFDATISPDLGAEKLRALVRGGASAGKSTVTNQSGAMPLVNVPMGGAQSASQAGAASGAGVAAGQQASRPAPARTTPRLELVSSAGGDPTAVGDAAVTAAILRGQDPTTVAVELIQQRLGDGTVEFFPADSVSPASGHLVDVSWESARFGTLRSQRSGAEKLTPHARWLAGWLRLRDQHVQLYDAAFTDPLTGAWNRRYFDRFLAGALDQAKQERHAVTVLLFDIDDFKRYNDLYGHEAGDEILVECVNLLRSVIRPSDRVCRLGGDEFAVIFHAPEGPRQEGSRHPASVTQIAQRFQAQVLAHRFPKLLDCAPGTLTISGGLATFPWDGVTGAELLRRADQLLLQAKKQGKNAITVGPGATRLG